LIFIANITLTFAPVARYPLSYILDLAHTDQIFQWLFLGDARGLRSVVSRIRFTRRH
jgi:hypothetical protein